MASVPTVAGHRQGHRGMSHGQTVVVDHQDPVRTRLIRPLERYLNLPGGTIHPHLARSETHGLYDEDPPQVVHVADAEPTLLVAEGVWDAFQTVVRLKAVQEPDPGPLDGPACRVLDPAPYFGVFAS